MELNEKLARWVWPYINFYQTDAYILDLDNDDICINIFTESLDACFEWLKPAVIERGRGEESSILTWRTVLHKWLKDMAHSKEMASKPALALCFVIEPLIDEQKESNK